MTRRMAGRLALACIALTAVGGAIKFAVHPGRGAEREWVLMPPLRDFSAETNLGDYIWPTDGSRIRSSSFAEFRNTHFHGGLDISTGGRVGCRVFASRGGWLHSITFEPFGYGWILALRHPDGFYTSYAHLKGFPDALHRAYWKKLRESGHSFGFVTWARDELPVKKGEVIAYTGESGAGPPHLHFELRDSSYNPVHPELAPGLRVRDTIAPVPLRLAVVPLDAMSSVNGSFDPVILSVSRSGGNRYAVRAVPVIRGRAGLMLLAHDRAQDAQDTPTPFDIRVQVDGNPFFVSQFSWLQETMGWHVRIDRDHWMMKGLKGEFRKLYREDGNFLAVYHSAPGGNGVLSAAGTGAGRKRVAIRAADVSGNASTIDVDVELAAETRVRADSAVVPVAQGGNTRPGTLQVSRRVRFDEVILDIRTSTLFSRPPFATMRCGARSDTAELLPLDASRYRAVSRGWEGLSGEVSLRVEAFTGGAQQVWTEAFDATVISAVSGGVLRSEDGRFRLTFVQGDVYRSMFCWLQGDAGEGNPTYRAFPDDVPIAGKPVATFTAGPGDAASQYVRAYHPGAPLRFNRQPDASGRHVAGAFGRYLATYTRLADNRPPVIAASAGRGTVLARFTLTDSLSGVDNRSIVARIGNTIVPVEFSEGQRCFIVPREGAAGVAGSVLHISASDRLGNTATREIAIGR